VESSYFLKSKGKKKGAKQQKAFQIGNFWGRSNMMGKILEAEEAI
jgi:hypothetical protein